MEKDFPELYNDMEVLKEILNEYLFLKLLTFILFLLWIFTFYAFIADGR